MPERSPEAAAAVLSLAVEKNLAANATDPSSLSELRRATNIADSGPLCNGRVAANDPDSLRERIRASGAAGVRPVFVIGPPRSGTTLMARVLAHGEGVMSLSEPFGVWRLMPRWMSRGFFVWLQLGLRRRVLPPWSTGHARFFGFLRELASRNDKRVLVIKEVFHDFGLPPPWWNVDLLDEIVDSGAAVIAIMRAPGDVIASTLEMVRRYLWGVCGLGFRMVSSSVPRFTDEADVVRHVARNWTRYAAWVRRHALFVVQYEQLAADPRAEVRRICAHADIGFCEQMVAGRQRPAAFGGYGDPGVLFRAPRPVHSQSVGRGRALSPDLQAIVAQTCGGEAEAFGYRIGA